MKLQIVIACVLVAYAYAAPVPDEEAVGPTTSIEALITDAATPTEALKIIEEATVEVAPDAKPEPSAPIVEEKPAETPIVAAEAKKEEVAAVPASPETPIVVVEAKSDEKSAESAEKSAEKKEESNEELNIVKEKRSDLPAAPASEETSATSEQSAEATTAAVEAAEATTAAAVVEATTKAKEEDSSESKESKESEESVEKKD